MVKIYGFKQSFNTSKVLYTAEEIGLDYEYINFDGAKGEHKSPEHELRHPLCKTPTLEDEGRHLFESATICKYMAEKANSPLLPKDLWDKSLVDQWMNFNALHTGRWIATIAFEKLLKAKFNMGPVNEVAVKEAEGFLQNQLPVLDNQLGKGKFYLGDQITIADTFSFAYMEIINMIGINISDYKNLSRWMSEMSERPAILKVKELAK